MNANTNTNMAEGDSLERVSVQEELNNQAEISDTIKARQGLV